MTDEAAGGLRFESIERTEYAAKLAERQYLLAVAAYMRIHGSKPAPDDPVVLALLQATSSNYATFGRNW